MITFDAVLVKQAVSLSSINGIALTKLDVLDNLERIKICIDYDPINYESLKAPNIQYIEMDGWKSSTVGITNFHDLPDNAKKYVSTIEDISNTKVVMISTGPSRHQIITLEDIFNHQ